MIALMLLIASAIWLAVAIFLSKYIPCWVGVKKHTTAASLLLFPLVLAAPIADELIGRWQFNRLCEREAVVTLNPDWEKVKRARKKETSWTELRGNLVPVSLARIETFDIDTGKVFMTSQSLFSDGGFLRRHLGLTGQATSCPPKGIQDIQEQVNLFELLKQGR
jgi:hypothetical protein